MAGELKTSEEWEQITGIFIKDRDGWTDLEDWRKRITKDKFLSKAAMSTATIVTPVERRIMNGWVDPHLQSQGRKHVAAVGRPGRGETYDLYVSDGPLKVVPEGDHDMLTVEEREFLKLTATLANLMRGIIGNGTQSDHDWSEAAAKIHDLQHMVMAQAASRAYPDLFRLLGHRGAWASSDPVL